MDVKILDLKQEQAGHGAVKLRAQLSFTRKNADHDWVTAVEGQGRNLAAAAESLAKNDKLARVFASHLTTALKEMSEDEPKETTGPKSSAPSGQGNPVGQGPSSSSQSAGSHTPKPVITSQPHSSQAATPIATASAPRTQSVGASSTPDGTKPVQQSSPEVEVTEF